MFRPLSWILTLVVLLASAASVGAAEAEAVRLRTSDGVEIRGEFQRAVDGPGGAAVIAVHMFLGDRSQFAPAVEEFTKRGIGFLAIDLRGHGESVGRPADRKAVLARDPAVFRAMRNDVAAAVEWLRHEGYDSSRIGLLGGSLGACLVLDHASRHPLVPALALLTPLADHPGLEPRKAAAAIDDRAVLVVAARSDAGKGATRIFAALPGDQVELRLPDVERAHGTALLERVEGLPAELAGWFQDRLGAKIVLDGDLSDGERENAEVRPLGESSSLYVRRLPDHIWLGADVAGIDALEVTIGEQVWVFDSEGIARKGEGGGRILPLPAGTTRGASRDAVEVLLPLGAFGLRRGHEIRLSVRAFAGTGWTEKVEGVRLYYPQPARRRD